MIRFLTSLVLAVLMLGAIPMAQADVREVPVTVTIANGAATGSASIRATGMIRGFSVDFPTMTGSTSSVEVLNSASQMIGYKSSAGVTDIPFTAPTSPSAGIPVAGTLTNTYTIRVRTGSTQGAARSIVIRAYVEY